MFNVNKNNENNEKNKSHNSQLCLFSNSTQRTNANSYRINNILKMVYPVKTEYNSIIPLNIYQTWHTKALPPLMERTVCLIKQQNPTFKYYLFDDNDCREFIKNNFDKFELYAFDNLIPGAYKADLWRYCVLYKNGGIYLDIKYSPNNFKFIAMTEKEHYVMDKDNSGIYNALMVCLPGNPTLLKAIKMIVYNVKNNYYGVSCLHPTGPGLLSFLFNKEDKDNTDMIHDYYLTVENRFIYFNNHIIFKSYSGYLHEHNVNKKYPHYSLLWDKRLIYKNIN